MKIVRGREGSQFEQRTDTFTGEVWGDVALADEGVIVNSGRGVVLEPEYEEVVRVLA